MKNVATRRTKNKKKCQLCGEYEENMKTDYEVCEKNTMKLNLKKTIIGDDTEL